MMGDVSVDEIIEVCSCITNQMIEYIENFRYLNEEFDKEWDNDILNFNDYLNNIGKIQEWQKDFMENIDKNVSKNTHYVQMLEEEIKQQKTLVENIIKENNKIQKDIEFAEDNLLTIKKKTENLMDLRDQVQICKLLTNTSFTYKGSIISGYVASKQINCFELDPEKLSKSDITNYLYNLIKKNSYDVKNNQ